MHVHEPYSLTGLSPVFAEVTHLGTKPVGLTLTVHTGREDTGGGYKNPLDVHITPTATLEHKDKPLQDLHFTRLQCSVDTATCVLYNILDRNVALVKQMCCPLFTLLAKQLLDGRLTPSHPPPQSPPKEKACETKIQIIDKSKLCTKNNAQQCKNQQKDHDHKKSKQIT